MFFSTLLTQRGILGLSFVWDSSAASETSSVSVQNHQDQQQECWIMQLAKLQANSQLKQVFESENKTMKTETE